MKVVTFLAYYTPEIAASMYLTTNLLDDWAESGIEVEVFVPTPTRGVDRETIEKYKKLKDEVSHGGRLHVHRFLMIGEGKGVISRALRYLLMNFKYLCIGLSCRADVIFVQSTPPTQGFIAGLFKKMKKIPMIYNLQDIFPDSLVHTGICSESSVFYKIGKWIEKVTYKNADNIIVISEDFRQNILRKGVPDEKITVVRNWVDENAVRRVERQDNRLFEDYDLPRDKFYVSYSGNIGLTQNMDMLLGVAEKLLPRGDIAFILVGDGVYRETVEKTVKEKNLTNVHMLPFQPYERISEVFSLGDAGLIISKSGVGNNSVPSKTWSYMSAEVPIIASFDIDSELQQIINKFDCGVGVEPDDDKALEKAVLSAAEGALSGKGSHGREYILENLTRKTGTLEYAKVLLKVYENQKK